MVGSKVESMRIEWNEANTALLRADVESVTKGHLWGDEIEIAPKLVSEIFGDGQKLLCISPMLYRPWYVVVRIDSGWDDDALIENHFGEICFEAEQEHEEDFYTGWFGKEYTDWLERYFGEDGCELEYNSLFHDGYSWGEYYMPKSLKEAKAA